MGGWYNDGFLRESRDSEGGIIAAREAALYKLIVTGRNHRLFLRRTVSMLLLDYLSFASRHLLSVVTLIRMLYVVCHTYGVFGIASSFSEKNT